MPQSLRVYVKTEVEALMASVDGGSGPVTVHSRVSGQEVFSPMGKQC